jgi:carbohydrate-binding DOMON domain-containing protein
VTVSGTSTPGDRITVAASNLDEDTDTTTAEAVVGSSGSFSLPVALTGGRSVLNIVATSPSGATARAVRTVVVLAASAPVYLSVDDPDGDDHGPGNYAYPKAGDFHAGAYDLEQFQVLDTGDTVTFRVRTRDLTPTFGSPLGAQLIDVYVHVPGATQTSTAAAYPQRNYTIAPGGAWSRRLEVQGFGQQYVDASGATLGTIAIRADDISRYITFSVPKASLGTPGPGWGFTVTLTGQDGFSADQARGFEKTPADYQFGVCATASSDPHCTVDPKTVPKVMDTVTPAGTSQATELDYTLGPVALQPVVMP